MAKRHNKKPKIPEISNHPGEGIEFEWEEEKEAEALLRAHLDTYQVPSKDEDLWLEDKKFKEATKKSKNKRPSNIELDLHGMILLEAKKAVDQLFQELLLTPEIEEVKIITGKGRHSGPSGSILAQEIHRYIRKYYMGSIKHMEDSPAQVALNGLPIRGHFVIQLKRTGKK